LPSSTPNESGRNLMRKLMGSTVAPIAIQKIH
jgi:hypothetical protein